MGVPLLLEAISRPVTTLAVCGCTAVWFYIQKHRLSYADVGVSYEKVVVQGQHWRIASATLSHISLLHLLFNMSALWSLGAQEAHADTLLLSPSASPPTLLPSSPSSHTTPSPPPHIPLSSTTGTSTGRLVLDTPASSATTSGAVTTPSTPSSSSTPSPGSSGSSTSGRSLLQAGQGGVVERPPGGTPEEEAQQGAARTGLLALLRPHLEYLKASVLLALLSEALALGFYHCLITHLRMERYRHVTGVGYSCVVFGWMTILSVQQPSVSLSLWGLVSLPVSYAPFESLVLTSFIVPNASFVGHLAGILVGYLLAWGVFSGFNLYWQAVLYFWLTVAGLHSLKTSGPFPMPFLEIQSLVEMEEPSSIEGEGPLLPLVPSRTADIV